MWMFQILLNFSFLNLKGDNETHLTGLLFALGGNLCTWQFLTLPGLQKKFKTMSYLPLYSLGRLNFIHEEADE